MPKKPTGIKSVPIKGTNGDDRLSGTAFADIIYGRKGNDSFYGDAGDDTLFGEGGDDDLEGGAGNDRLYGGDGNDRLSGSFDSKGNDILDGGDGVDTAVLSFHDSSVSIQFALTNNVTIVTPEGTKTLVSIEAVQLLGSQYADVITGGAGADYLSGFGGDDKIVGGFGSDLLHGGMGNDLLTGGRGADTFDYAGAPSGNDVITDFNRAEGDKIAWSFDADQTGRIQTEWVFSVGIYRPDLANHGQIVLSDNNNGTYTLSAFYAWHGSSSATMIINTSVTASDFVGVKAAPAVGASEGKDNFVGTEGSDVVNLLGGDDRYDGRGGDDIITGGAGRDILIGGAGNDVFRFNSTSDSPTSAPTGNPETDHLIAANTADVIYGFEDSFDLIDLSGIDADSTTSGNQAFTLVARFSGNVPGELRILQPAYGASFEFSFNMALVQGDVDGDGAADFTIAVADFGYGPLPLTSSDFIF